MAAKKSQPTKDSEQMITVSDHKVIVNGVVVASIGEGAEVKLILHKNILDPREYSVKLMKMSKGYQWEISCKGPTADSVYEQLIAVDKRLSDYWGGLAE